jgi:DNA-binding NtrC family response regulator
VPPAANADAESAQKDFDSPAEPALGSGASAREQRAQAERRKILQALEMFVGNQTRAAAHLGIPRRTFVAKLAAYDIPRPRKHTPWPGLDPMNGDREK